MHFAYIDPGAGSLLVQAVIAAIISVPFFFRRNLSAIVRRARRQNEESGAVERTAADTEG